MSYSNSVIGSLSFSAQLFLSYSSIILSIRYIRHALKNSFACSSFRPAPAMSSVASMLPSLISFWKFLYSCTYYHIVYWSPFHSYVILFLITVHIYKHSPSGLFQKINQKWIWDVLLLAISLNLSSISTIVNSWITR